MKIHFPSIPTFFFAVLLFAGACSESNSTEKQSENPASETMADMSEKSAAPTGEATFDGVPDHATDAEIVHIKAKFLDFHLGDASHYIFEAEDGGQWDFGRSEAENVDFVQLLPDSESNEDNQGWGPNTDLQGAWFDIGYYEVQEEQYIDGPIGTVYVIAEVSTAE